MADTSRERDLEAALFRLYETWARLPVPSVYSRPYYAERFRQMIVPGCKNYKGGVAAVKRVLTRRTLGFERLKPYPDLTVESLIATGEWDDVLGGSLWRDVAVKRLARHSAV